MSRLAPLSPPYKPDVQKTLSKMVPEGMEPLILFRTIAHNPRVLERFSRGSLLDKGSIPLRVREILILRTCALCGSEYEWGVHVSIFAEHAKFTEEQVASSAGETASVDACWDREERDLLALAEALHAHAAVPDDLWDRLAGTWQPEQLMEMVVLSGFYHTVSFLTGAFDIALEDYGARFPG
jgi:hypothetical protein